MSVTVVLTIAVLFLAAAILYSSVGHGGASGYLAVMALFGMAPVIMKPTALTLNVLVSLIATVRFYRAGCFSWALFWPFALTSVPAAFVGGGLLLPTQTYRVLVGAVLLYAAVRMFSTARTAPASAVRQPPLALALLLGVAIGLLSGLTGVGGGIFLSPLLLLAGWAGTRETSGVASLFILVNSIAGLLGHVASLAVLPASLPLWGGAVLLGGAIGAEIGSRRLAVPALRQLLSLVLVVAGLKLIFT